MRDQLHRCSGSCGKRRTHPMKGLCMKENSANAMKKSSLPLLCHSVWMLFLLGCTTEGTPEGHPREVESTSRNAQSHPSSPDSDESATARIERVRSMRKALSAIDKQYPPAPDPSADATQIAVEQVLPDGTIALANGKTITMEGVECSSVATENLKKMLLGRGTTIVFVVPPDDLEIRAPAQFWVLERFGSDGAENPAYSVPAETALINGWCKPACASEWPNCPRYQALSRLANP